MKITSTIKHITFVSYANNFDTDNRAWYPEVWAAESLMVLEENLVAGNMVHRDFENEIKSHGDIVNTRRPGKLTMKRKSVNEDITIQPVTATKVQVPLNQHLHTSFLIRDEEQSKSMADLISEYLVPGMRSIARGIDSVVLAQKYRFMANSVGKLGTPFAKATVIALKTKMDNLLIPDDDGQRSCIVTADTQGDILSVDQFTDADKFGDGGSAIRRGSVGMLYGTQYVMSQNNKTIQAADLVTVAGTVNLSAGYAAGSTVLTVAIASVVVVGSWLTIAGDMTPQLVTAATTTTVTTSVTISPGLKYAVVNSAAITVYTPGAFNITAGSVAGYGGILVVDGFTTAKGPQIGQLTSFAATSSRYGAMDLGSDSSGNVIARHTSLLLDRPLVADIANNVVIGIGPAGNFNWGFHRNAVALVCRPLALPPSGMGARSAVLNLNGLSVRVTMSYDAVKQGVIVTIDCLIGVALLDVNLGVIAYG